MGFVECSHYDVECDSCSIKASSDLWGNAKLGSESECEEWIIDNDWIIREDKVICCACTLEEKIKKIATNYSNIYIYKVENYRSFVIIKSNISFLNSKYKDFLLELDESLKLRYNKKFNQFDLRE